MRYLLLVTILVGCSDYQTAKVTGLNWEHRTHLRERTVATDSQWYRAPSTAGYYDEPTFNVHCHLRANGSTCIARDADGFCTAEVDDYDPYCTYSYYSWPVIDTTSVNGRDYEFSWHTYKPNLSQFRETRSATYTVWFATPGKGSWFYETSEVSEYHRYKDGDIWELKFPIVGSMYPTKRVTLEQI